jgi:hypothetical protein
MREQKDRTKSGRNGERHGDRRLVPATEREDVRATVAPLRGYGVHRFGKLNRSCRV